MQEGGGITENQQSALGLAAGNTFSQNGSSPDDVGDFNNEGSFINYFYYDDEGNPSNPPDTGQEPIYYTDNSISKEADIYNECNNGKTGGEIPGEDIGLEKERFFEAEGKHQLYKAAYKAALDGGDTPGLVEEVNEAKAWQAAALASDLLAISPYVSQQVLQAVVDRPAIFTNAMQVDVLEANPEAVRKESFLGYLEENSSLNASELDTVRAVAST